MYHVQWPLYHELVHPTGAMYLTVASLYRFMVQGPVQPYHRISFHSYKYKCSLVSVPDVCQVPCDCAVPSHGTGWSARVPYDRISPVRIPPLLSGAALTLHPPYFQYVRI